MFSSDNWQEIFQTIKKNKLRTFLSGFTITLGLLIFIILLGLGNGLKNSFNQFFMDDATNTMFVFPGRTSMPYKGYNVNRTIQFKNDDLTDIKKNFPFYLEYITPRIFRNGTVTFNNESNSYSFVGVSPAHQISEKTIMMRGRYINDLDVKEKTKYAVVGRLVEKDLFKDKSALGEHIIINNTAYKVIGVFQDEGGDNEERRIYVPYTTLQLIEKNTDDINQIVLAYKPELGYAGAMLFEEKLTKFLKEKHEIAPDDQSGVFIRNIADNMNQNQQLSGVLTLIVTFVGIGTLIAGVIGISNIMVFVIKERTKEIGVRKALGATPFSIITMILQESIFITLIAGYVGLFLGVFVLKMIGDKLEDYFILSPYIDLGTAITATIILILFGALAGYVPAKRAARIQPIVALRDE
ncbi:MAG: ABC transporter permease [Flavobacteriales bacterium]|nr:ABC transporter permease [Flavobacteriales bacterium]MCW8911816.1 ABC transporter permease [Flavobacteriales bacterium]MCW8936413.1 ABC transporter permease [Flavobacteriales bacterium]MCW8941094.1 ABC transporter permease [Flavobacteriales bacterium]MCW8967721.1 ABC transporter permease [Flavobacteriales bacterium]